MLKTVLVSFHKNDLENSNSRKGYLLFCAKIYKRYDFIQLIKSKRISVKNYGRIKYKKDAEAVSGPKLLASI